MPSHGFGREVTVDEVMAEVMKDKKYYATDNGGVTFSGGEPTFQPDFLLALITKSKALGIHICLETNGLFDDIVRDKLLPLVDLWLYDYKATENHKKLMGAGSEIPLRNLKILDQAGACIILRCPIIPNVNDNDTHYNAIERIKNSHQNIARVEFMPYHNLGEQKKFLLGAECNELHKHSVPKS